MPRIKESKPEEKDSNVQIREAVGNTNQEQIDRRNAIADRADEARAAEMQEFDGKEVVEPDPEEARAAAEAQAAEAERSRLEAEATEAEARALQEGRDGNAPRMVTLKINGRDVQMTESERDARAAKVASADEYLQMAQEAVKRSQALAPSTDVSAGEEEDFSEDTLTSALQGDREAIRKVAQRLKGPSRTLSPDVLNVVDDRVRFLNDVDWFRNQYQDVTKDPFLYRLVVEEDKKLAQSEPHLSYRDRMTKAGDTIRDWKKGFSKPTPETNPKLVRKASTPSVPSAGSRQSAPKDEEAEETVENVIDAMAKARGQDTARRTPQGMFGVKQS